MGTKLIVLAGPMFSGKSDALIGRIKRHTYAKKRILIVKPQTDTRKATIRSRKIVNAKSVTQDEHEAFPISSQDDLEAKISEWPPDVLVIDEAQFFGDWLIDCIKKIVLDPKSNMIIYVAGLDLDAWCNTFGPMGNLMALANEVVKMTAVCFNCGQDANLTMMKKSSGSETIQPGDIGNYEARCPICWQPPTE